MRAVVLTVVCLGATYVQAAPETKDENVHNVKLKLVKTGLIEMDVNAICRAAGYITPEELIAYSSPGIETISKTSTSKEHSETTTEKHEESSKSSDLPSTTPGSSLSSTTKKDLTLKTITEVPKRHDDTSTESASSTTADTTTDEFGNTLDPAITGKRTTRQTTGTTDADIIPITMGSRTPVVGVLSSTTPALSINSTTDKYSTAIDSSTAKGTTNEYSDSIISTKKEKDLSITPTNATTTDDYRAVSGSSTSEHRNLTTSVTEEVSSITLTSPTTPNEYSSTAEYSLSTMEDNNKTSTLAEESSSTTAVGLTTIVRKEASVSNGTTEHSEEPSSFPLTTVAENKTTPTTTVPTDLSTLVEGTPSTVTKELIIIGASSSMETTGHSEEVSSTSLNTPLENEHKTASTIATRGETLSTATDASTTQSTGIPTRPGIKAHSDEPSTSPAPTGGHETLTSGSTTEEPLHTDSATLTSPPTEPGKSGSTSPTVAELSSYSTTEINTGSSEKIRSEPGKKMDYRILGYLVLSLLLAAIIIWISYLIYTKHQANSYVFPPTAAEVTPLNNIRTAT